MKWLRMKKNAGTDSDKCTHCWKPWSSHDEVTIEGKPYYECPDRGSEEER